MVQITTKAQFELNTEEKTCSEEDFITRIKTKNKTIRRWRKRRTYGC